MSKYSFIDFGLKDFVHYDIDLDNEDVVIIEANSVEEAEDWLLTNGDSKTNWTNTGTRYWNWNYDEDYDDE